MRSAFIERMREVSIRDVAERLGIPVSAATAVSAGTVAKCPACNAERAAARNGKLPGRGSKGIGLTTNGLGGRCHACGVGTDALDYASRAIAGRSYKDCDRADQARVRAWCQSHLGLPSDGPEQIRSGQAGSRSRSRAQAREHASAPAAPEREYPAAADLDMLWKACRRVDCVPEVASYLASRGIDARDVADHKLAAAIDHRVLPAFAAYQRVSWALSGHLLIVHMFDHLGVFRSVIARRVRDGNTPKSLPPAGHRRTGLVMACPLAQNMLRHGAHPSAWPDGVDPDHPLAMSGWWPADEPLRLVICEGEIDFLSWATEAGEDPFARAVIGIVSGGWKREHADRVPAGAHITIATDHDEAGDKYAAQILSTFAGRVDLVGRVTRWSAP